MLVIPLRPANRRNKANISEARFTALDGSVVDDINHLPGGNGPLRAAGAMAYSYWMSYIGNVLGTQGHTKGWVYTSGSMGTAGIFMLGWDDKNRNRTDAKVTATTIRE